MAEEQNTEVKEVVETELSPVEQKAHDKGWRPKDEWVKSHPDEDPADWRSAELFLALDPFYKKIDHQNKQIKEAQKTLALFSEHHKKVSEAAYNKALNDLKKEKKAALVEGNVEVALEIDDKIDEIKEERQQVRQVQAQPAQPNPEVVEWVTNNKWYNNNSEARDFANITAGVYMKGNPTASPSDLFAEIEKKVRKAFPEIFTNPARQRPSAVETEGRLARTAPDAFKLDSEQEKAMRRFVRAGVMTEAQYIAELKESSKAGEQAVYKKSYTSIGGKK